MKYHLDEVISFCSSLLVILILISIPIGVSSIASSVSTTGSITIDDQSIPFTLTEKEIVPDGNGGYRIQNSKDDINIVPNDNNKHSIDVTLRNNSHFYLYVDSNIDNGSSGVTVNVGTHSFDAIKGQYYYYPGAVEENKKKGDYHSASEPSTANDCFYVAGGQQFTIEGIINPNSSPNARLQVCIYFFDDQIINNGGEDSS